jgi:hypothetical protein
MVIANQRPITGGTIDAHVIYESNVDAQFGSIKRSSLNPKSLCSALRCAKDSVRSANGAQLREQ